MMISKYKETVTKIILFILLYISVFFPISSSGMLLSDLTKGICSIVIFLLLFVLMRCQKLNTERFKILLALFLYLIVASFVITFKGEYHLSIFRLFQFLICLMVLSIDSETTLEFKQLDIVITILTFIIAGVNIMSLMHNQTVCDYIVSNYTQYLDYITRSHLTHEKPIFTFGVHNIAAFFYMALFMLSLIIYDKLKKKKYLLFTFFYFTMLVFLKCTTSIGFILIALLFLISKTHNTMVKAMLTICLLLVGMAFSFTPMFDNTFGILTKESNGFLSRYSESTSSIFTNNFLILKSHILGTGFAVPNSSGELYYADSGFFVNLLNGNIVYTLLFYYSVYQYICTNIHDKENRIFSIIFIVGMEVGFVTFQFYRTLIILLLFVFAVKAVESIYQERRQI